MRWGDGQSLEAFPDLGDLWMERPREHLREEILSIAIAAVLSGATVELGY